MAGTAELAIFIRAKDDASRTFDSINKKAGGLGSALGGVTKIASGFVMGMGLMQAPGILMDMTQAAADDAASCAKLEQAVKNTGYAFEDVGHVFDYYIEQAQKRGFTDDQARDSLALLTAQTGDIDEATRRFAIAQDLARGANIDVTTASKLLGKVTEDNVNVLGRYGIAAKEGMTETELFGMVQEKFGGQAEAFANSTAGQMEAAKIQMGELKETIGYALLPVMTKLMQVIADNMPAIRAFIDEGIRRIKEVMEALAPVAQALWDNFKTGLETIYPPLKALAQFIVDNKPILIAAIMAIGAAIAMALGPGTLAVLAILGIITLIGYLRDHWDEIKAKTEEIWNAISDFLNEKVGFLQGVFQAAFDAIKRIVEFVWADIQTIFQFALDTIKNAFGFWKDIFSGDWDAAWQHVKDQFGIIWDLIKGLFENRLGLIKDIASTAVGALKDIFLNGFNAVKDGLLGIFNGIKGGVITMVNDVVRMINGLIDALETGVNAVINAYNAIPLLPDVGNINLPSIPYVPTGGGGAEPPRTLVGGWYQYGGTVPGPYGRPQLVVAHGGEEFRGMGGQYPSESGAGTGRWTNYGRVEFHYHGSEGARLIREQARQLRGL
jgi:hypothetical protein